MTGGKYTIKGKGTITLSQKEFKAQGGEGSVFIKGGTAFKIYNDPNKMIPVAKISELSVLTLPNIIRPEDVILDSKNTPVGYSMKNVDNSFALCQMFPRAFRDRNKITPDMSLKLVQKLQKGVSHIHDKNLLVVDLNEMNFLINDSFNEIYFIDVDSYQTKSFPATAIMDSIRDRSVKNNAFNQNSDWFSFGIISCMMLVGLHPFKGKHPTLKTLDERMLKNISIFNSSVGIPPTAIPFDVIPDIYKQWYKAIFEDGKRMPPPDSLTAVIVIQPTITRQIGSNNFNILEMYTFPGNVIYHTENITITTDGIYMGDRKHCNAETTSKIGFTPKMNHAIIAHIEGRKIKFRDLNLGHELNVDIEGESLMAYNGRFYIKRGSALLEVEFIELPNTTIINTKQIGNVMEQSTQMFEGVVFQNLLDTYYASFVPVSGTCIQTAIKELKDYQIVEAKCSKNVLVVIGTKQGKYDKFIFRFNAEYTEYDVRQALDISYTGINFTVLDNGLCLHVNENDELEIFSSKKGSSGVKIISDPAIASGLLFHQGTQAMFAKNNKIFKFSMK